MKKEKVTTNKVTSKLEKGSLGCSDPDVYRIIDRNVFRAIYGW